MYSCQRQTFAIHCGYATQNSSHGGEHRYSLSSLQKENVQPNTFKRSPRKTEAWTRQTEKAIGVDVESFTEKKGKENERKGQRGKESVRKRQI